MPIWRLSPTRSLALDRPRVMAILNLTSDSFSDGGSYPTVDDALRAAEQAVAAGADLLDVGGESTRPGAPRIPAAEQIARTAAPIAAIRRALPAVPITIDTTLAPVAAAALDAGADAVNDVSAGTEDADLFPLAAGRAAGLVLMHRLAPPPADSYSDRYATPPDYTPEGGVVAAVARFLAARAAAARAAGLPAEAIVLDPGLGFGKTVEQNLELIARTPELCALGYPVLSGISRKSFTARAAGLPGDTPPRRRVHATLGLSLAHAAAGAAVFRVHDVPEHVQALAAWRRAAAEAPKPGHLPVTPP